MSHKHLTVEECFELLKKYNTPPHVIRHCQAVADTAVRLASALNEKGGHLDIELIRGAALIHDIARTQEHHEEKGAQIAQSLGYEDEAEIIHAHMTYELKKEVEELTEIDMVCLGDRMVKEDQYVGLSERMAYILDKVKDYPDAVERIKRKQVETEALLLKIESRLGRTMDELMDKER
ncbi:HDIG domain-containing metalloprotein [Aminipila luticellarii]|uniref:HD domain-containing protein n=1 Tax=Aminipila luticellarii TaxID=2507160 RepID=A0A410PV74_9FIRM|nr:HDIG domain-containing metalloprotein [Aminipila luticellarii]QAT42825.1 HD domain-containing protein [Aminipila luticellarii]